MNTLMNHNSSHIASGTVCMQWVAPLAINCQPTAKISATAQIDLNTPEAGEQRDKCRVEMEKEPLGLCGLVSELREAYECGRTRSLAWRQSQLKGLHRLLSEMEEEVFTALHEDLGKHYVESYRDEVGILGKSVDAALRNMGKWMAPDKVHVPLIAFPATAEVVPEPLGVVLIFSCWNFPLGLSLEPLVGAIAAGNAVVLKPSEHAPSSAKLLADNIERYLDSMAVKVVQGGPEVGEQLMEHRWDKVLFTGSPRIGRRVMVAAAKHLTPVALELGGKCPGIFDSLDSARDRQVAVNRVIGAKWSSCAGQACISIDYLLVEERFVPILIGLLKSTMKKFFTKSDCMARIVNARHFERLSNLLKDPSVAASIVHGGSSDFKKLWIEPTILLNPPLDSEIMTEEIFGPLLPIITLKNIEDSIAFVKARSKPLAIYAFTHSAALRRRIVEETSSGSVTFNDAIVQYGIDSIPFGGVGQSGFGKYHGKYSFDMFSHKKPVLRRGFLVELMLRYPPWNESKVLLMRYLYRFDYIGFALAFLGLRR